MQHRSDEADPYRHHVSILTRCKDRVQLGSEDNAIGEFLFQSSPGAKTGCNFLRVIAGPRRAQFQSSPGAKTGCNSDRRRRADCYACFNPHPVQRPGATIPFFAHNSSCNRFNPHPVQRPGATRNIYRLTNTKYCFNPHPVQRPGATPCWYFRVLSHVFQSSPGAKTGCNPLYRAGQPK